MNKRFFIVWLVVFLAWMGGSFVIHEGLLKGDYMQIANLYRPVSETAAYFPWMVFAHVLLAGAFVWIYSQGVQARPWVGQGLRYGVAAALLSSVPMYIIYYVVQPLPTSLVIKQIVFVGVLMLVLGLVVASFYRDAPRPL